MGGECSKVTPVTEAEEDKLSESRAKVIAEVSGQYESKIAALESKVAELQSSNQPAPEHLMPMQQQRQPQMQQPALPDDKKAAASLGVVRLDYDYPPAPGDIDSPESYDYDVFYRTVPGLTFGMCQHAVPGTGTPLPAAIMKGFVEAIQYLDQEKNVSGITADCGFFFNLQHEARKHTKKPVFMSSLCMAPSVAAAYGKDELVAIFTANQFTLEPMRELIKKECGIDPNDQRFVIVGCQDVPIFGKAVADGLKVDWEAVTPHMVELAKATVKANPTLRAIIFECTELPPYSDAVRQATGLPVFDSITTSNAFIASMQDNLRFGANNWQYAWDEKQDAYKLGQNLSAEDKAKLQSK